MPACAAGFPSLLLRLQPPFRAVTLQGNGLLGHHPRLASVRSRTAAGRMHKRIIAGLAALALATGAPAARAQIVTRPHLDWRTVRTEHFAVHYPREMEARTLDPVPRLEAIHAEVAALVGHAPAARVTVVVEDPSAAANGFAFPFLDE